MVTGTVVRFDEERGYGFIAPDDGGEDVFVHANVLGEDKHAFTPGVPVEFQAVLSERGPKALSVRIVRNGSGGALQVHRPTASAVRPAGDRLEDEGVCDVLTASAFRGELTELFIESVPTLTGAQIGQLRQSLVALATRHGWVEG